MITRRRQAALRAVFAVVVSYCAMQAVSAGSLQVDRTRIELSNRKSIGELTLLNTGATPSLIQTQVFSWSQRDGKNQLTPSQDLLVSPPIAEIAPGAAQLLRVGLIAPADETQETTYRLVIQEVPRPVAENDGGAAVSVLLRISFPVFVQPNIPTAANLNWQAKRTADGNIKITLSNTGNAHVQVRDIEVSLPDGTKLTKKQSFIGYVLPGEKQSWELVTENSWSGSRIQLSASTEQGRVHADLELEGG